MGFSKITALNNAFNFCTGTGVGTGGDQGKILTPLGLGAMKNLTLEVLKC